MLSVKQSKKEICISITKINERMKYSLHKTNQTTKYAFVSIKTIDEWNMRFYQWKYSKNKICVSVKKKKEWNMRLYELKQQRKCMHF